MSAAHAERADLSPSCTPQVVNGGLTPTARRLTSHPPLAPSAGETAQRPLDDGYHRQHFGHVWTRDTDALPVEWSGVVHRYAEHLRATGRTEATAYGYARNVRTLAQDCAGLPERPGPWDLTHADLEAWLSEHQWSRHTRHRVTTSVRGFYTWAIRAGLTDWSPAASLGVGDHREPGPPPRTLPPSWSQPVADYLIHLRAGARTDTTVERYRDRLTAIAQHAGDPWAVTTEQIEQWLSSQDWAPETKRTTRAIVRGFYGWAERTGRIDRSPAVHLPTVRVPRAVPRPIPADALRSGLRAADDRTRLAMLLAAYGGLRRAEIARLHWHDVDHHVSLIVRGKGGHERRVPLHPDLGEALASEWTRRSNGTHGRGFSGPYLTPDGYLFASPHHPGPVTPRWLGRIVADRLPDGWTLHTLRHRFATQAYASKRDIRAVQELLGHAKPETTARYAATADDALLSAVANVGLDS